MKILILATFLFISGCYVTVHDKQMDYENQRNQDLIMQHGAGGCTPNFSTGGCL